MAQQQPEIRSPLCRVEYAFADFLREHGSITLPKWFHTFMVVLPIVLLLLAATILTFCIKFVNVTVNGSTKSVVTFKSEPVSILEQCGVTPAPDDSYVFSGFTGGAASIRFFPAFNVSISADHKMRIIKISRGTVSDALKKAGVKLGNDDLINMRLNEKVYAGASIKINRVTYDAVSKQQPIPYSTITLPTTLLKKELSPS